MLFRHRRPRSRCPVCAGAEMTSYARHIACTSWRCVHCGSVSNLRDPGADADSGVTSDSEFAHITWTGMATYGGSSGPSSVEDMFVTGEADFARSPLPIRADEYFVRQTR